MLDFNSDRNYENKISNVIKHDAGAPGCVAFKNWFYLFNSRCNSKMTRKKIGFAHFRSYC